MKYRTVALKLNSWKGPSLMTYDNGKWHFGNAPQHFSGIPESNYTILKEYGNLTEAEIDALVIPFTKEFYPLGKPTQVTDCGWLAPNGDFYACESWGHDTTAGQICKCLLGVDEGNDHLIKLGWVRVSETYTSIHSEKTKLTQAQINTLWDIHSVSEDRLKMGIEAAIHMQDKW